MVDSWSYSQINFKENKTYNIAFNDGREFVKMKYVGTKLLNGKSVLCFKTEELLDVAVNPSYVSFIYKKKTANNKKRRS